MDKFVKLFRDWLATSTSKQKWIVALLIFGALSTLGLMVMTGTSGTGSDPLESSPFYFVSVFVKLIIVLLLIVLSSMTFRRWLQPGWSGRKTRQVQLLETVRLSPKQAVHLLSVGGQQLLIGATDQNVSLLTQVELELTPIETEASVSASRPDFASLLHTINLHTPGAPSKSN